MTKRSRLANRTRMSGTGIRSNPNTDYGLVFGGLLYNVFIHLIQHIFVRLKSVGMGILQEKNPTYHIISECFNQLQDYLRTLL
jgi:hypothetical protein